MTSKIALSAGLLTVAISAIACGNDSNIATVGRTAKPPDADGAGTSPAGGAGGDPGGSIADSGASPGLGGRGGVSGAGGSGTNPPVDPGISFTWPETDPGLTCKPGHYTGTFGCDLAFDDAGPPDGGGNAFQNTAMLDLTLGQSQNGELTVSNGKLSGTADGFFDITADLTGTLDCTSGRFNGQLMNGMYTGFIFINGTFDANLEADYDKASSSFVNGSIAIIHLTSANISCTGTWSAQYAP